MKRNYHFLFFFITVLLSQNSINAQCATTTNLGTATNMITLIRNATSSIAANKNLNTISFIHRNNVSIYSGSSGHLRFDLSTNGGASWVLDQGVMNTTNTNPSRYPNIAIYNPASNTNTANVWLSYLSPIIDPVASTWIGVATGVSQLNATGTTETYNQNGIGGNQQPNSLVTGSAGVMWAIDPYAPSNIVTGFKVYKGVWNGVNDFTWNTNFFATPTFNSTYLSVPSIIDIDMNIGFDPTGTIGWVCFPADLSNTTSTGAWYPVFYKTTDGGNTWTGPITVDLTKFSCITSNVSSGSVSMNAGNDLVVDANGNPHMITTVGSSSAYTFNYNAWHHMYDITLKDGLWVAYDLDNVNGAPYSFGVTTFATQWQTPQASRSSDGTKVFLTWTDNTGYSLGAGNSTPDLFGKAYDVVNDAWTPTKNFTSCNANIAGKIMFPHIAAEALEPNTSTYLIPAVYGEPSSTNNLDVVANFKYLDNLTFSTSDFSLSVPPATVTIQQGSSIVLCPNSTLSINVLNAGQSIWSNGATTNSISVTSGTTNSYSVTAQVGCNVGTASVTVNDMMVFISASTNSVCLGDSALLLVMGNALSYTWSAGNMVNDSVTVVSPVVNTTYVLNAGGSSCIYSNTISVGVFPTSTLTIAGNNTVCLGSSVTQTATGGYSYAWSNGDVSDVATITPTATDTYTLTNTDVNSCVTTKTFVITTVNLPVLTITSLQTGSICPGNPVTLLAGGASTYSWSNGTFIANTTITPSVTTTYTVTGRSNSTGCSNYATYTQLVNACTGIKNYEAENSLAIYPNPNSGELTLTVNNFNDNMSIEIFNTTGQLVLKENLSGETVKLDLTRQPEGIYFVTILQNGRKVSTAKIVKQ